MSPRTFTAEVDSKFEYSDLIVWFNATSPWFRIITGLATGATLETKNIMSVDAPKIKCTSPAARIQFQLNPTEVNFGNAGIWDNVSRQFSLNFMGSSIPPGTIAFETFNANGVDFALGNGFFNLYRITNGMSEPIRSNTPYTIYSKIETFRVTLNSQNVTTFGPYEHYVNVVVRIN